MPTLSDQLDEACDPLADLRRCFVERTRSRVELLRQALAATAPTVESIAPLAHQLAGSAGTFGYARLGRAAAALEDAALAAHAMHGVVESGLLTPHLLAIEQAVAGLDAA
jgi:HPt (histidine-containing phosphotransfer) domain-containing protein